jgi:prepilin-type N-terminal cleavage/methylation domain-containing protein
LRLREKERRRGTSGFTTLELLIVVAILAILASVLQVAAQSVTLRIRDGRRVADFKIITKALEMYRLDHGSAVPQNRADGNWVFSYDGDFLQELVPKYLKTAPRDPLNRRAPVFNWFDGKGHYYAYFYYNQPSMQSAYYGCGTSQTFGVFGVRKLEAGPKDTTPNARCGPPEPFVCPPWGIAYVCRDWGNEFEMSTFIRDYGS